MHLCLGRTRCGQWPVRANAGHSGGLAPISELAIPVEPLLSMCNHYALGHTCRLVHSIECLHLRELDVWGHSASKFAEGDSGFMEIGTNMGFRSAGRQSLPIFPRLHNTPLVASAICDGKVAEEKPLTAYNEYLNFQVTL